MPGRRPPSPSRLRRNFGNTGRPGERTLEIKLAENDDRAVFGIVLLPPAVLSGCSVDRARLMDRRVAGTVRGDVVPRGGGLGERFRGDVRQGQHQRGRGVQGAAEPGENQVRTGPVAKTEFGSATIVTVRRWRSGDPRVDDGTYARATRTPSKESRRRW